MKTTSFQLMVTQNISGIETLPLLAKVPFAFLPCFTHLSGNHLAPRFASPFFVWRSVCMSSKSPKKYANEKWWLRDKIEIKYIDKWPWFPRLDLRSTKIVMTIWWLIDWVGNFLKFLYKNPLTVWFRILDIPQGGWRWQGGVEGINNPFTYLPWN